MKVFLMYRDHDFGLRRQLPFNAEDLSRDLELSTLFNAMASGDPFLYEVAKVAVLSSMSDPDAIIYRQRILDDCIKNPAVVREMYEIAVESIENKKKHYYGVLVRYPGAVLRTAIDLMQMFLAELAKLKSIAEAHVGRFDSEGFTLLFAMLKKELEDDYLASVEDHLNELKLRNGVLVSAQLGMGNKGIHYVLRKPNEEKRSWLERLLQCFREWMSPNRLRADTLRIADRDETGARALSELKDRGINLVADALARSAEHILSFFELLRTELAFYVGCLNLSERLAGKGEPMSFPVPLAADERSHSFKGLYDVCLALSMRQRVVGNDGDADHKALAMITGANQGGKSTFLRSIGLAQLMMQCGMFVPAEFFRCNICDGLFTHYKREEDVTMSSGKLDEELSRMSDIIDRLRPNSLLLFNESFAATNEREGSEIAGQITRALVEKGVKVFFVTHLFEFAQVFYARNMQNAVFFRAERQPDGSRTFKVIEGGPLATSYGVDLYRHVFGATD